jgi:hypothetical protein
MRFGGGCSADGAAFFQQAVVMSPSGLDIDVRLTSLPVTLEVARLCLVL